MKILIVHNEYGKYSGEEAVVDKMVGIFSGLGHEVAQLRMSTAGARESLTGKMRGFISGIWCPSGVRAMREALRREKPDVVNVHNLYPFISPAALRECRKAGVPVIMTIHNFRLICPTGLFMRDGAPCELCLNRGNEWGCVKYNCEHSLLKSAGYAARNAVARLRRHYMDCVDLYACITDFQRRKLTEAGFPADRLHLIPNSVDLPDEVTEEITDEVTDATERAWHAGCAATTVAESPEPYVAFCGRISREKGIDLIIEAARRNPDIPFRLAGAVADPNLVADIPANISLSGYLTGTALNDFYRNARFMVMASRWYEGFPMAILEAARHHKATIGPDHGGFTEIIGTGTESIGSLFTPGDADTLSREIRTLWDNPDRAKALGEAAHTKLRTRYSTPVIAQKWQKLLSSIRG
ncbi:glycosyltransferase family 4 protein [uncultured Duncaniella sp.]|uniref:glycosyltransferase family 4 protein n=1 Tax=uncultured Duncaniella sp. TaxID=2768039 RepID=UPI00260373EF|nr:glycosyltransferase family 4 protein [uncultured Duncaniella sp.]